MCAILHANEHFGHYARFINDAAAVRVEEVRLAGSSKGQCLGSSLKRKGLSEPNDALSPHLSHTALSKKRSLESDTQPFRRTQFMSTCSLYDHGQLALPV